MPTVNVPLTLWSDIPALKRSKAWQRLAKEEAQLSAEAKRIKARRDELKLELYDELKDRLPEDVKSVRYDYTYVDPETEEEVTLPLQFTAVGAGKSRSFKVERLLTVPIVCSNPKCRTENHITADEIEECYEESPRKPTVRVEEIKEKGSGK